MRNTYKILAGKLERKRSLVGPAYNLDDNIKMEIK
jgi:hypothetical protein